MSEIAEAFRTGGPWMYFILTAAIIGWPLAALGLLTLLAKKPKLSMGVGAIVCVIGLGTMGVGGLGYAIGMSEVEEAITHATPENRDRLRQVGEQYAAYPLKFGLGAGAIPLLLGLLTIGGGVMQRQSSAQG